ncbi:HNH endonuclease [Photobacterium lipolyticum]|uniref:HNH domain-containing protein n=1 Tax=Photobacterium lipolyticum TaxID=266810 RepID=A0A2T3N0A6_9GAMM|nr:HNH endonuclease [Photobacterium lipolyticum]PSW05665.1 hypothetical protein C9I89_07910 [Photobacterium lipolyticum]
MFYPKLKRRTKKEYHNRLGQYYADYRKNYDKIAEDCKHRCVYCDILVDEMGGEGMQLDHFRPQHHFPTLATDPYNLYLSCPKCNVLKSKDWPCSKDPTRPSFVGSVGYLDSFSHQASSFLVVDNEGAIVSLGGPVNYMVKKLSLNRLSRTQIRRKRVIDNKKNNLSSNITMMMGKILKEARDNPSLTKEEILNKLENIQVLQQKINSL